MVQKNVASKLDWEDQEALEEVFIGWLEGA